MFVTIRKNQQFLTTLIVGLTIIAFIWLYNRTNLSQVGANDILKINGTTIQRSEVENRARQYQLATALGQKSLIAHLTSFASTPEVAISDFVINGIVLEDQAKKLGVEPTEAQVAEAIKMIPMFQENGVFTPEKYQQTLGSIFAQTGFTQRELEAVVAQSLRSKRVYQLITSPIAVSDGEIRDAARIYQPFNATYLTWKTRDYLDKAKKNPLTEKEERDFYQSHQQSLMTEETRVFEYGFLELPPSQKQLKGKERIAALQELANKTTQLQQESANRVVGGKTFSQALKEKGIAAQKSDRVNRYGLSAKDPSQASASAEKLQEHQAASLPPLLTAAGFKLQQKNHVSDPIQIGDRFYIMTLDEMRPSRPLSFEEAKPQIEKALWYQKATALMQIAAMEGSEKIKLTLQKAGQAEKSHDIISESSFTQAIESLSKEAAHFNHIIPAQLDQQDLSVEQKSIVQRTLLLQPGQLSQLETTSWGKFMLLLTDRGALTQKDWQEHYPRMHAKALEQQKLLLFNEWLMQARSNAHIVVLQGAASSH